MMHAVEMESAMSGGGGGGHAAFDTPAARSFSFAPRAGR
jgi:hypothetical protein